MSFNAATTFAVVLPALLVIGLLGPLLAGWKIERPERGFFASQTVFVVIAEGILLYYIAAGKAVPAGIMIPILFAVLYALLGIVFFVLVWAKRTPEERAESQAANRQRVAKPEEPDDDPLDD